MMPAEDKENSDFAQENGWVNIEKKSKKAPMERDFFR
jgi:hypothetical protein